MLEIFAMALITAHIEILISVESARGFWVVLEVFCGLFGSDAKSSVQGLLIFSMLG